jgi:RND family efflux transporter MFP subunit
MYKADDLTEETEEIILRRAQRDVDYAKFAADFAQSRFDKAMETDLPRERIRVENAAARQAIAALRAEAVLPASLEQKRIELKKLQNALTQAEAKHKKLAADLEQMTLKSPVEGVVRYGRCDRGRWKDAAQLEAQLREGGTVSANQALFTIVSGDGMIIRADIPEAQLHLATPGKTGTAIPAGFPQSRLQGRLEAVDLIAVGEGIYDGRVSFTGDRPQVTPGMSANFKLVGHFNENAISVPSSAVFTDEADDTIRYVLIAGEMPEKRVVKVGLTKDDSVEILDGLKAGEKILLEKPKT